MPIFTLLRSPPEMPRRPMEPTTLSAAFTRFSSEMTDWTRFSISSRAILGMRRRAVNTSVSRTVDSENSASSCSTYADIVPM